MPRPLRQSEKPLPPEIARLVEGIALTLAQEHHAVQEELDRKSTRLLTTRQAADVAQCGSIKLFRLLVDEGIFPKAAAANKRWQLGVLKLAVENAVPKPNSATREIYFVGRGDFIKIGVSSNIDRRLRALQTSSPSKLELIYSMRGSARCEKFFHRKFAHLRQQGEWFRQTPGLRAYIIWLSFRIERQAALADVWPERSRP